VCYSQQARVAGEQTEWPRIDHGTHGHQPLIGPDTDSGGITVAPNDDIAGANNQTFGGIDSRCDPQYLRPTTLVRIDQPPRLDYGKTANRTAGAVIRWTPKGSDGDPERWFDGDHVEVASSTGSGCGSHIGERARGNITTVGITETNAERTTSSVSRRSAPARGISRWPTVFNGHTVYVNGALGAQWQRFVQPPGTAARQPRIPFS